MIYELKISNICLKEKKMFLLIFNLFEVDFLVINGHKTCHGYFFQLKIIFSNSVKQTQGLWT